MGAVPQHDQAKQAAGPARTRTDPEPSRALQPERDAAARVPGMPLSPAQVLRLQRTVGNRAVQRLLRAQRPAPGAVQRAMYLANSDGNIYKDSDDDATEYAYLTKGQIPFFIEYPNVAKLQANAAIAKWAQQMNQRDLVGRLDSVVPLAAQGDADAQSVLNDLGTIRAVADSKVVKVPAKADMNYQLLVGKLVHDAVFNGPSYWNTGGGSRLPRGRGALLYPQGEDSVKLLQQLGLGDAELAEVQVMGVPRNMLQGFVDRGSQPGESLFPLSLPGSKQVDVVYVSTVTTSRSKNSRVTCAGKSYADDFSDIGGDLLRLTASFNSLTAPTTDSGWVPGTELTKAERGDGQAAAMAKWNALGAAAFANHTLGYTFALDQNWEWLHVRGAQIGGRTEGGNLVPGLFVTNSLMIPYESMVRSWAEAGPKKFWARFRSVRQDNTVFASRISIDIRAVGHPTLGTLEFTPLIDFDPIRGVVVDKVAGELIKRGLDQTRGVS